MTKNPTNRTEQLPADYPELLERLKREIATAHTRAALAVNERLIGLYWRLGREILERQKQEGWGARVVKRLSVDLREAFPNMKGLSEANLRHMRAFAQAWPEWEVCSQAVSNLPWGHNLELIYKLDESADRLWYAQSAVEGGWSRKVPRTSHRDRALRARG
jgi:predicted nuclease of restriction endonuclease-like (RecB) superfamily